MILFFLMLAWVIFVAWQRYKRKRQRKLFIRILRGLLNTAIILAGLYGLLSWFAGSYGNFALPRKTIYWPPVIDSTPVRFDMNGAVYTRFNSNEPLCMPTSDTPIWLDFSQNSTKPIANIKHSDKTAGEKFLNVLWYGMTDPDIQTVCPIPNEGGFDFYDVRDLQFGTAFFSEDQRSAIEAWYGNLSRYDTQCLRFMYFTTDARDIDLQPGVFARLLELSASEEDQMRVPVPEGCMPEELYAYSKDGLAHITVMPLLVEGQVYIVHEWSFPAFYGYPLDGELNQYLIDTLFSS
ncbi:MAG: hypothetical protein FWC27_06830 [Firmicutes bacterium]|nr:hypothetical protein [Bacillota bacterium]